MKNKKRMIGLLFAAGLSLVIIPFAALAQNGTTESLDDEYINLGKVNEFTVDAKTKVPDATVNTVTITRGEENVAALLSKTGDYKVELSCDAVTYDYNVFCYRRGDANVDDVCDVRDLVAAYRRDKHTEVSAGYGADMDGDTLVDDTDYKLIRKLLVGKALVLPEVGESADKHMTISAVDLSNNEFSVTFKNTSKVWEVGENSYVKFTCLNDNNEILSTQEVKLGTVEPGSEVTCKITLPDGTANVKVSESDFDYWSITVK